MDKFIIKLDKLLGLDKSWPDRFDAIDEIDKRR